MNSCPQCGGVDFDSDNGVYVCHGCGLEREDKTAPNTIRQKPKDHIGVTQ